ncbi:MAG: DNA polymerase I [Treponema sp.]|jgi:DNA polymerase-1|nr:DNA polymerase I [Treponema sp.]
MSFSPPPLYLIDAYGLIYRSYFAFIREPLRNKNGKNTSALFGFARTVVSLIDDGAPAVNDNDIPKKISNVKPLRLAAIFDSRTPTFRHKMYPEYKANRQKTPDDLHEQVPLVEEFLTALGVKCIKIDGFEADDIIATLAEKCRAENRQCYILSSDKDLLQLVGNGIYEFHSSKSAKADAAWEIIGTEEVRAEWSVAPDRVLDLLSLIGDTSDNIPGVKGIGEKTAVKLMARYGSLDEIYKNIAAIEGSVGKKIAEGKESAYFSQKLIRLKNDVELPIAGIDDLSVENLNRSTAAEILLRENCLQIARKLDQNAKIDISQSMASSIESVSFYKADSSLLGEGVYKTIFNTDELKFVLEQAKIQKYIALDFETDSLNTLNSNPVGISLAIKPKEAFYIPVASHGSGSEFIEPDKVRAELAPLFSDSTMTIIAHNAKFDYKVSRSWGIERWQCKIIDTMVCAWLVDPDRGKYTLDTLVKYFFYYTPIQYKDIVSKNSSFASVPLETAARYSGEDADFCLRLKIYLEPLLEKTEASKLLENIEMPLLPVLAEMEDEGILIEPKTLEEFGVELDIELNNIQNETWKIAGHEFNLSSPKQLQEVLFVERKLTPGKKIKTGYSTDVEVLEELAREDPIPALILRHRTLSKLKSNYADTLADMTDTNGRLHTNFIQTGTATGRLSSREPNLQNIPIRTEEGRHIRKAFVAKPGSLLISADYSQIELVILAHFSQDKNLITAFKEEKDVHARTAALIFGVDEKQVSGDQRRMAKTINFGVMYGMSAFRLANELNISRTEANNFIAAYFETYSDVRKYIEDLIHKTEQTGYVTTIFGRRRYIPTINSPNKTEKSAAERITVNTPIQGSAADIVKTAMLNLDKNLLTKQSSVRLLLQVHDELIFECPENEAEQISKLIKTEMENAITLSIPLRANVEIGKRWGDFH